MFAVMLPFLSFNSLPRLPSSTALAADLLDRNACVGLSFIWGLVEPAAIEPPFSDTHIYVHESRGAQPAMGRVTARE
jgi:hypothetical protein